MAKRAKKRAAKKVPPKKTKGKDPKTGRFVQGNRFWEVRSSHGRNPIFADADQLWAACVEYFDWVEKTPLYADRLVSFQGNTKHEPEAKMRAMTIGGLCLFLDITLQTWSDWRKNRPEFSEVITRAESIIYQQKFSGAAADMLNANIIARDLGLADKSELTGKNGGPIQTTGAAVTITTNDPAEASKAYQRLINGG